MGIWVAKSSRAHARIVKYPKYRPVGVGRKAERSLGWQMMGGGR